MIAISLGSTAQASFVVDNFSELDVHWSEYVGVSLPDPWKSPPVERPKTEPKEEDEEQVDQPLPLQPAQSPATNTSMSGGPPSIGGPVNIDFSSAAVTADDPGETSLLTRRLSESQVDIPVSHRDRLFRPPRHCV